MSIITLGGVHFGAAGGLSIWWRQGVEIDVVGFTSYWIDTNVKCVDDFTYIWIYGTPTTIGSWIFGMA